MAPDPRAMLLIIRATGIIGSSILLPTEILLPDHGVLYLDEAAEFSIAAKVKFPRGSRLNGVHLFRQPFKGVPDGN